MTVHYLKSFNKQDSNYFAYTFQYKIAVSLQSWLVVILSLERNRKFEKVKCGMKCLCQMSRKQLTIKLQKDTIPEQITKIVSSLSLKKTQIYFSAKTKSLSKGRLNLTKAMFRRMDLLRSCFLCSRSKSTRNK